MRERNFVLILVLVAFVGVCIGVWLGRSSVWAMRNPSPTPVVLPISEKNPAPYKFVLEQPGTYRLMSAGRINLTTNLDNVTDLLVTVEPDSQPRYFWVEGAIQ